MTSSRTKLKSYFLRLDTVSLSMPKYLGYLVPTFASKVVPRPLSGVAYNVASETVVPYIVDKVIPSAMDHLLSDETRVSMAIDRSLRESKQCQPSFSEIVL